MASKAIDYIPHDGKMALIDEIIETGESYVICTVKPEKSSHFSDSEGRIPSWLGIEYMAQTIAAYAGWKDKQKGDEIQAGFLLGSRKLTLHTDFFEDKTIYIRADLVFQNDELGSFKCSITDGDNRKFLAEANVNVFQPEDFRKFIEENNSK